MALWKSRFQFWGSKCNPKSNNSKTRLLQTESLVLHCYFTLLNVWARQTYFTCNLTASELRRNGWLYDISPAAEQEYEEKRRPLHLSYARKQERLYEDTRIVAPLRSLQDSVSHWVVRRIKVRKIPVGFAVHFGIVVEWGSKHTRIATVRQYTFPR